MPTAIEAFQAMECLGASWNFRKLTKKFVYDTAEITGWAQSQEGVLKAVIEVQRWNSYRRVKIEVTCFLGGLLLEGGKFEEKKYSREKATAFQYENVVLFSYSKWRGWRPTSSVSGEHLFLVRFADQLAEIYERQAEQAEQASQLAARERVAAKEVREAQARQALFG